MYSPPSTFSPFSGDGRVGGGPSNQPATAGRTTRIGAPEVEKHHGPERHPPSHVGTSLPGPGRGKDSTHCQCREWLLWFVFVAVVSLLAGWLQIVFSLCSCLICFGFDLFVFCGSFWFFQTMTMDELQGSLNYALRKCFTDARYKFNAPVVVPTSNPSNTNPSSPSQGIGQKLSQSGGSSNRRRHSPRNSPRNSSPRGSNSPRAGQTTIVARPYQSVKDEEGGSGGSGGSNSDEIVVMSDDNSSDEIAFDEDDNTSVEF